MNTVPAHFKELTAMAIKYRISPAQIEALFSQVQTVVFSTLETKGDVDNNVLDVVRKFLSNVATFDSTNISEEKL